VREGEQERWRGTLGSHDPKHLAFSAVRLAPGENRWRFETDQPGQHPASGDPRELAINLRDLEIELTGKAER
jgi:hypothetical protein